MSLQDPDALRQHQEVTDALLSARAMRTNQQPRWAEISIAR
jgi:hypothetical protein